MVADEQLQGRAQEHTQQPEAEQAGQPAEAGHAVGQGLQQHLTQAVQPVRVEFHQHLRQAARQRIEQEVGPIRKESQPEVEQAREPS